MAKPVGQVLREIREAAGLSRSEVARKAKVDPSVLWRLENPKTGAQPSFDLVRRVTIAIGANLDDVSDAVERKKALAADPSPKDYVERIIEAADALRRELGPSLRRHAPK